MSFVGDIFERHFTQIFFLYLIAVRGLWQLQIYAILYYLLFILYYLLYIYFLFIIYAFFADIAD